MRGEQRESVGADRIEGDIAKVEKAGEPDHDVEAEAEHHIGEYQDGEVEQIAQRQPEVKRPIERIGEDREIQRAETTSRSAPFSAP